jgi:hypothetical protein
MAVKESSYWIADAYAAVALTRSLLGITLPEPVGKEASESSALQNIFVKMKEPCITAMKVTATSQHSVHHQLLPDPSPSLASGTRGSVPTVLDWRPLPSSPRSRTSLSPRLMIVSP